ncbi:hypothetical protein [Paucisalibacillus globulus]|uniref:hypothetical protein n=1 Tax=Paucisalibacillus globulus TaxID=351095 RepID=UPI0015970B9F|nr:hypothetical protein [Paucisalibacillus globulus]
MLISKRKLQDAERFAVKLNSSVNNVVSKEAVQQHINYLINHVKVLEVMRRDKSR